MLPSCKGRGVGKMIIKELRTRMDTNVPENGSALLFVAGKAKELYRQNGFVETTDLPISGVGMACMY